MSNKEIIKVSFEKLLKNWKKTSLIMIVYAVIVFMVNTLFNYTVDIIGFPDITKLLTLLITIPMSYAIVGSFMDLYDDEDAKVSDFLISTVVNAKRTIEIDVLKFVRMIVPIIIIFVSFYIMSMQPKDVMEEVRFKTCCNACAGDWERGTCEYEISDCYLKCTGGDPEPKQMSLVLSFGSLIGFFGGIVWLILLTYNYVLTKVIGVSNNELSSFEVTSESKRLMKKNKFRFFKLQFFYIVCYGIIIFLGSELYEFCSFEFDLPPIIWLILPAIMFMSVTALYNFAIIGFYDSLLGINDSVKENVDSNENDFEQSFNYVDLNNNDSQNIAEPIYGPIPLERNYEDAENDYNKTPMNNDGNFNSDVFLEKDAHIEESKYSFLDTNNLYNKDIYKNN